MSDILIVYAVKILDIWDERQERTVSLHRTLDGAKGLYPNAEWVLDDESEGIWRNAGHKGTGLHLIIPTEVLP